MICDFEKVSANGDVLSGVKSYPKDNIKALLVISHDICSDMSFFSDFISFMAENGIACIGHDIHGHGKSVKNDEDAGYVPFCKDRDIQTCDYISSAIDAKSEIPGVPLFAIGYGVGSFISMCAVKREHGFFSGSVFISSADKAPMQAFSVAMSETRLSSSNAKGKSALLENLVLRGYNFKNTPRPCISSLAVTAALRAEACSDETAEKTENDLPLLLIAGSKDKFGLGGEGILSVGERYAKHGTRDCTVKIIPGAGHNIFASDIKKDTFNYILSWINERIGEET